MDKFCNQCGAELNENGLCPNCSEESAEPTAEAAAETNEEIKKEATEEVREEQPEEPAKEAEPQDESESRDEADKPEEETKEQALMAAVKSGQIQNYDDESEPQNATSQFARDEAEANDPDIKDVQPTKFYYAFRQVGRILKKFFSRHAVRAITSQYSQQLPIWVILLPISALISALSMTLSFDSTNGLSIGAGRLFSDMKLSYLEVFLISFAMSVAIEFVYSIAVVIYFKAFKVKISFKSAANLTMSAYIAVSVVDVFNILTVGYFKSESTTLASFGMIAFILLLYLGITRVLKGKKPFWSFFFMMTCASVSALIIALIISCPIIVIRGLEELADTTTVTFY